MMEFPIYDDSHCRKIQERDIIMTKYRLYEEILNIEGAEVETFGIAAFDENGEIIGLATNITTIKEKALFLLEKCRRLAISPCHLIDIAEDFIISDEY